MKRRFRSGSTLPRISVLDQHIASAFVVHPVHGSRFVHAALAAQITGLRFPVQVAVPDEGYQFPPFEGLKLPAVVLENKSYPGHRLAISDSFSTRMAIFRTTALLLMNSSLIATLSATLSGAASKSVGSYWLSR